MDTFHMKCQSCKEMKVVSDENTEWAYHPTAVANLPPQYEGEEMTVYGYYGDHICPKCHQPRVLAETLNEDIVDITMSISKGSIPLT